MPNQGNHNALMRPHRALACFLQLTRELIDGGMRQLFNETNILLTEMDNMKGAINAHFKKMSQFIADSNYSHTKRWMTFQRKTITESPKSSTG